MIRRARVYRGKVNAKNIVSILTIGASSVACLPNEAHAKVTIGGIEIQGFVRTESAFDVRGNKNPNNQDGNLFNETTVARTAYVPPALFNVIFPGQQTPPLFKWGDLALENSPNRRGDEIQSKNGSLNYQIVRLEAETTYAFSESISLTARVRALYDPDFYASFDAQSVSGVHGGIVGGEGAFYHGRPDFLGNSIDGKTPNLLEMSGRQYSIDLPTFVFTYSEGPINVRLGNQAIAWGQALFFRTFDVPAGLDLRRHLFIDRALEEYADERISSPAIRFGYQLDNGQFDAFASQFQPSVLPSPNTPYNVVPAQFTIHDRYFSGGYDKKVNYGVRFKADYGTWGWQAMAAHRFNPDYVFRWTQSGVERPFQGATLGTVVNNLYSVTPDPSCKNSSGTNNAATALSHTGLSNEPGGVYSADEWTRYAADARLNQVDALNHLINDLSTCAGSLGASPVASGDFNAAHSEVDTFTIAAGNSLRGHIERRYFREDVFGLGASYVTSSSIDFLDQIVLNLEGSYTPDKKFTSLGLGSNYTKRDDYVVSISADKWHRFTPSFPGMLLIAQVMYRNNSDLVGRLLDGYGGTQFKNPKGVNGVTYVVFGGQQPFPNRIYEAEFATLIDTRGGAFVQLGMRWNPGHGWHVEGYWNGTSGKLWGSNPNNNLIGSVDFIDEVMLRVGTEF